jgi:hypothetical protein
MEKDDTWVFVARNQKHRHNSSAAIKTGTESSSTVGTLSDRIRLLSLANNPESFAPDDIKIAANNAEKNVERAVQTDADRYCLTNTS